MMTEELQFITRRLDVEEVRRKRKRGSKTEEVKIIDIIIIMIKIFLPSLSDLLYSCYVFLLLVDALLKLNGNAGNLLSVV